MIDQTEKQRIAFDSLLVIATMNGSPDILLLHVGSFIVVFFSFDDSHFKFHVGTGKVDSKGNYSQALFLNCLAISPRFATFNSEAVGREAGYDFLYFHAHTEKYACS
jgi:hypothetical protein